MPNKTYGQLCPLARALDVLGDRWTLLLIREFLLGPKRFKELLATLPTMGTNRLSERLALLVSNGVIQQLAATAPTSGMGYELTAYGERLRKPVMALALWGLELPMEDGIDIAKARGELIALGMAAAADPARITGLQEQYEFQVGAEVFHIQVNNGQALPRSGASTTPADIKLVCDMGTFLGLALGQTTPAKALNDGAAHLLKGDRKTVDRVFKQFRYRPDASSLV